jgi:nitrate reductase beta subunit
VAQAKRLYRNLAEDPELLAALLLFGSSQRIITRFQRQGQEVLGWDLEGREVARVPFTEPVVIREHFDDRRGVYRHNTT